MFCLECIKTADKVAQMLPMTDTEPIITITDQPNTFIFTIESTGSLLPIAIVKAAIDILTEKFKVLKDSIL